MKPGISAMPAMMNQATGVLICTASASAQGCARQADSAIHTMEHPMAIANFTRIGMYRRFCWR